ncbi:hypothetical protein INT43_005801 [Umbelopsis isabellina]|uniref:Anaphase-promoting complex subunit 4-like WD40 domain-containing protein n=1 Tax=Mortierella isabellina TaxID=91625 RepID=A0A8H7UCE0_MORIS|nr:hypothetical protein INT43_005801 [Umbelopsis isabellina]
MTEHLLNLFIWQYKLVVYRPDGSRVTTFSAYDDGLGIKSITWSPTTQLLAINSYDHKSRILSTFDWKQLEEFTHHTKYLEDSNLEIHVEKEVMSGAPHAGFDVCTSARHIPMLRPDHEKANPKTAINTKFNCMGNFMMTLSGELRQIVACVFVSFTDVHLWSALESIPTTACIWDMSTMASHAIIALQEPIVSVVWNPKIDSLLAICCESGRFYIWRNGKQDSHRSALSVVNIPAGERKVFGDCFKCGDINLSMSTHARSIHSKINQMESRWTKPNVNGRGYVLFGVVIDEQLMR